MYVHKHWWNKKKSKFIMFVLHAFFLLLKERIERCALDCQDKARDKHTDDADVKKLQSEMENCVAGCVNTYNNHLPAFDKRLRDALAKIKDNSVH